MGWYVRLQRLDEDGHVVDDKIVSLSALRLMLEEATDVRREALAAAYREPIDQPSAAK